MSATSRHAFLGGNTSQGFFSYFHHLIRLDGARRLFIIKGGPGSGKSHFMWAIGNYFLSAGHDVELFHCASDPDSLDAVHVPAFRVAWVDGTAPHIIDPRYPGTVDVIVDFGRFSSDALLYEHRSAIMSTQHVVADHFRRAFAYLRAAKTVHDILADLNRSAVDPGLHNEVTESLTDQILGNRTVGRVMGRRRQLFAAAITPEGIVHHLPSLMDGLKRRFILLGEPGTGKSKLLGQLSDAAQAHGFDIETLHNPLDPEAVDHLIIPALDTGVVTSTEDCRYEPLEGDRVVNLNELRSYDIVQRNETTRREAADAFRQLLELAVRSLSEARRIRMELEDIYIRSMDFARIDQLREEQIRWVLETADQ